MSSSQDAIDSLENEALKEALAENLDLSRNSLIGFTDHTKEKYEINWHHRLVCDTLDKFVSGEIKRLMIFQPPRTGKSEHVSRRLPAYIFGHNPKETIIATSYSDTLAARVNRDVQRVIDSPSYRQLFPNTQLYGTASRKGQSGDSWLRNSSAFEIVGHGGIYRSAGVGGGITGFGATTVIIDDPIKDQKQADSKTYRDMNWEWYTSTLSTRLEKNGKILLTMTRWHEDDLAGRLLKLAKEDSNADQWHVLSLPMIKEADSPYDPREPGEPLWPNKFDAKDCEKIKANGSRQWNALYQQRPSAESGDIFRRDQFKYWTTPPSAFDRQIQMWDLTFKVGKDTDFVVGQIWGSIKGEFYLLDLVRARMDFVKTIDAFRLMTRKWPLATEKCIEDKANGPALISTLKREISGIIPIPTETSKVSRAYSVTPFFEAGNVYFPHPSIHPWVGPLIEEMTTFPNGAHDDQVDVVVHALRRLSDRSFNYLKKLVQF